MTSGWMAGYRPLTQRIPKKECKIGEPVGIRTRDLLIKSQLLYQLSYGLLAAIENISGSGKWVNRR
jgi:hypothetical protein